MFVLNGSCHCGSVRLVFSAASDPASVSPRCCDCSFCRKHGALYVSDPNGALLLVEESPGTLIRYRQGSNTADFQLCARCGVCVAALLEHDSITYGAVNIASFDGELQFAPPRTVSPRLLDRDQKVARWLDVWTPNVRVIQRGVAC